MKNSYIVVTGASGWLGKTMVEALYNVFPYSECQQRLALFSSKRKDFMIHGKKNDIPVSALALQELPAFAEANPVHSFIHTAFLTKDRIGVYGLDRFIRIGDATKMIQSFIKETPHLLVSLLYLVFDIYEPTKVALREIMPRVIKGGVVAFDELNCAEFAGETRALLEEMDLRELS